MDILLFNTPFLYLVKCEKCHSKMLEVPAKFAEMITEQFKVQCTYAEKGCKEAIPFKVRKVKKKKNGKC